MSLSLVTEMDSITLCSEYYSHVLERPRFNPFALLDSDQSLEPVSSTSLMSAPSTNPLASLEPLNTSGFVQKFHARLQKPSQAQHHQNL